MNYKRKLRCRFFLLMRSRTPPISSEFRGRFEPPLGTPLHWDIIGSPNVQSIKGAAFVGWWGMETALICAAFWRHTVNFLYIVLNHHTSYSYLLLSYSTSILNHLVTYNYRMANIVLLYCGMGGYLDWFPLVYSVSIEQACQTCGPLQAHLQPAQRIL